MTAWAILATMAELAAGVGWFKGYISNAVLLWYLLEKNLTIQTEDEFKTGVRWVVKYMLGGEREC